VARRTGKGRPQRVAVDWLSRTGPMLKTASVRVGGELDFLHTLTIRPGGKRLEWYESEAPGFRAELARFLDNVDVLLGYATMRQRQPRQAGESRPSSKLDDAIAVIKEQHKKLTPEQLKYRVMRDAKCSERTWQRAFAQFMANEK
jgi:hypothetical protein